MIANNKVTESLDLFSFLSNDPVVREIFAGAVAEDQANATLSWKFKLYYRIRWMMPIFVRQILQRQRNANFELADDWFIPKSFVAQLAAAVREKPIEILHPWPDAQPCSFVLTHDVETKYGLDLIDKMAHIEEKHGLRSAWNLIPKKYKIDDGLLDDLHARGFEIGVHGYNHDGRLFESRRVFESRADFINESASRFKASGFRAPMVHRDLDLIVKHLDFEYDASCFDIDPFQAMSGGVGSIWPFMVGPGLVELPYTTPQDHTLFVSLDQSNTEIWQKKFEFLKRNSAMVMLLTHPDYMDSPARLEMYDRFLGEAVQSGVGWHALPTEVASWWVEREKAHLDKAQSDKFSTSLLECHGEEIRIKPIASSS